MKAIALLLSIVWMSAASAREIERIEMDGVDVVWSIQEGLPIYSVQVYFAEGALADPRRMAGATDMMLRQLTAGTKSYTQKQILDILDFYAVSPSVSVFHDSSSVGWQGLVKDFNPTMKMMCHLFRNATFPVNPIKSYKKRIIGKLANLSSKHGALATRALREFSFRGTALQLPTQGKLKTIRSIQTPVLKRLRARFNDQVKKRIYVSGPSSLKQELQILLKKDCKWSGNANFAREIKTFRSPRPKYDYYLVSVKGANQAQIRLGRTLESSEKDNYVEAAALSNFLGGGFLSALIRELRVKRGLTYSAGARTGHQKSYGRSLIVTFTKNQTLAETLNVIKGIVADIGSGKINPKNLANTKRYLSGNHMFAFESAASFLNTVMSFDHYGRSLDKLYEFPEAVKKLTPDDLAALSAKSYGWNSMFKVVVGAPELEKVLRKLGRVKVIRPEAVL